MEYFSPVFGLITKHNPTTENGGIFLAQYMASNPSDEQAKKIFLKKMDNAIQPNGLYKRSQHHTKRSVSHDEITGMMASSKIAGTIHRNIIWSQLKQNFWAYPAVVENFTDYLPYNPANYYAWGSYVGSRWSKVFFPFYLINMMISLQKPAQETSSKLIYWLELNSMPTSKLNKFLKKYYESKVSEQYGDDYLKKMRYIYFHTEEKDFPLLEVLE